MFATCRAEFSADPQQFTAKHLHPVVTLAGYRAHNGCSYGRTILHDMKPICPTCNHRMSPATGSLFICAGCRELVQSLMSGLSILHCRGGKVRGATYQTSNQRMDSMPGPTKANPCRLSRLGKQQGG